LWAVITSFFFVKIPRVLSAFVFINEFAHPRGYFVTRPRDQIRAPPNPQKHDLPRAGWRILFELIDEV